MNQTFPVVSQKKSLRGYTNLLDALMSKQLIDQEKYKSIRFESINTGQTIESILISKNIISENDVYRTLAEMRGIGFADLKNISIPIDTLNLMPMNVAKESTAVVFEDVGSKVKVAMIDPLDLQRINYIQGFVKKQVEPYYSTQTDINYVIDTKYGAQIKSEVAEALEEFGGVSTMDLKNKQSELDESSIDTAPIIKIVNMIMEFGVKNKASDIHIEVREDKVAVRFRIRGVLTEKLTIPKKLHSAVVTRIKILSNLKIDEHRIPQDGRFQVKDENQYVDVRVSVMPGIYGEKIVMRLLEKSKGILDLDKIGISGVTYNRLRDGLNRTQGIILVTGPTGSGKTQTLASCLKILNSPGVNIITLEDPVEIRINGVNQTQVNSEIGLTFASGLRAILRQDPDVILVGEIRDSETASLAVQSALVGRLVLSTLHTNSAAGSFIRLIDMGIEPFLLTSTINVTLAQRLIRTLDPTKSKPYSASPETVQLLHKNLDSLGVIQYKTVFGENLQFTPTTNEVTLYSPQDGSNDEAYNGRTGIFEALKISDAISQAIVNKESIKRINEIAISEGMITMVQDGFTKALMGITTLEEVLRVQNL